MNPKKSQPPVEMGVFADDAVANVQRHLRSLVTYRDYASLAGAETDPEKQGRANEFYVLTALGELAAIRDAAAEAIRQIALSSVVQYPSRPSARRLADAAKLASSTVTRWAANEK